MPNKSLPKEEIKLPRPTSPESELDGGRAKPELNLPKPDLDLPLPEKELPAEKSNNPQALQGPTLQGNSRPFRLPLKFFALLLLFVLILTSGFVLLQNNAGKTIPTSPTPATDKTATWKSYANSEFNFSVKYPNSWKIEMYDKSSGMPPGYILRLFTVSKTPGYDSYSADLSIKQKPDDQLLEDFAKPQECVGEGSDGGCKLTIPNKQESIEIAGVRGLWQEANYGQANYNIKIFIPREGEVFIFEIPNAALPNSELKGNLESLNIFKNILSTFKFTDETANWKIYTGNVFSIKYPASWTVEELLAVKNINCIYLKGDTDQAITACSSTDKFSTIYPEYINNQNNSKITINGYNAYRDTRFTGEDTFYHIVSSNEDFVNIGPENLLDKVLFDKILSTFKFTDQNSSNPLSIKLKLHGGYPSFSMLAPVGAKVENLSGDSLVTIGNSKFTIHPQGGTEYLCPNTTEEDWGKETYTKEEYSGGNEVLKFNYLGIMKLKNEPCLLDFNLDTDETNPDIYVGDSIIVTKNKPNNIFTQKDINTIKNIMDTIKLD